MRCPVCQTESSQLVSRTRRGVTVDLCAQCGGMWLDAGELDAIASARFEGAAIEAVVAGSRRAATRCRDCGGEARSAADPSRCGSCAGCIVARCPRHGCAMDIVELGGIELDLCPQCRGLWVDGDERGPLGGRIRAHVEASPSASAPVVLELDETRLPGADDLATEVTCEGCRAQVPRRVCVRRLDALWCERCVAARRVPGLNAPSVSELQQVAAVTFAQARADQVTRREQLRERARDRDLARTGFGQNAHSSGAFGDLIASLRAWFRGR